MSNDIKKYWEERAGENKNSVTGTTNDVFLRELEIKTFCEHLTSLGINKDANILDVGCGDGYTTLNVADQFPHAHFTGIDYSANMIANARENLEKKLPSSAKISFNVVDATSIAKSFASNSFDFILSDRCLINLESSTAQYETIQQISTLLKPGGYYLAIENFAEGQHHLNKARQLMGLTEIAVRWHNLFFVENEFMANTGKWFNSVKIIEFSSAYYFATRLVYAAMCKSKNEEPDYLHDIHKMAVHLPLMGNVSPIKLVILKK